jgi:hypothetical protein
VVATEPLSIRFTAEQLEKVARLAEIEDRSQASVVRRAVDALDDGRAVRSDSSRADGRSHEER